MEKWKTIHSAVYCEVDGKQKVMNYTGAIKKKNGYAAKHVVLIDEKKTFVCHGCLDSDWFYKELIDEGMSFKHTGEIKEVHSDLDYCKCCGDYYYN